jgi:hypothetical protein
MSIPSDADYLIDAYKGQDILIGTWHRGEGSRDVEISVFVERMMRGEVDYIIVQDRNKPSNSYKLYANGVKVTWSPYRP